MPDSRNLPRENMASVRSVPGLRGQARGGRAAWLAVLATWFLLLGWAVPGLSWMLGGSLCLADSMPRTRSDAVGDAVIRRTDLGAMGAVDPVAHRLPDIVSCTIGYWECFDPQGNPFSGTWVPSNNFFRLDVVFKGLVNPPGPIGCCGNPAYDPFMYGPHPVLGYVELDVDENPNTGGESDRPELRYLGNVARLGGLPRQVDLSARAAVSDAAFDKDIVTPPQVDRSGEDFHLELQNWNIESISRSEPNDMIFGPGETWRLTGRFFARAHGYEPFSTACCSGRPGSYWPRSRIQFAHSLDTDMTTVSLVYPLTNTGSAQMGDSAHTYPEADDGDPSNQNSIYEGLADLVFSVLVATPSQRQSPNFAIIAQWENQDPAQYLDPAHWGVNLLFGTSYASYSPGTWFVWTDVFPSVTPGDFDGDGRVTLLDLASLNSYIAANDGRVGFDTGSAADEKVVLPRFSANFSVFDVDYDGTVSAGDIAAIPALKYAPGDLDSDGDVDLDDFGRLQACLSGGGGEPATEECGMADLDKDDDVDHDDTLLLVPCLSGAGLPADPMCGR